MRRSRISSEITTLPCVDTLGDRLRKTEQVQSLACLFRIWQDAFPQRPSCKSSRYNAYKIRTNGRPGRRGGWGMSTYVIPAALSKRLPPQKQGRHQRRHQCQTLLLLCTTIFHLWDADGLKRRIQFRSESNFAHRGMQHLCWCCFRTRVGHPRRR